MSRSSGSPGRPALRGRRGVRAAAVLAVGAALALSTSGTGEAAIPPTGPISTTTTLTMSPRGTLQAVESASFDVYREAPVTVGGSVHAGFRLPDRVAGPFPTYLRPTYRDARATADGTPVDLEVDRVGHRFAAARMAEFSRGPHKSELRYVQVGGARVVGKNLELRWRQLSGRLDSVTVHGKGLRGARCVSELFVERPCGRLVDGTLQIDHKQLRAQATALGSEVTSVVILADPKDYRISSPSLDRGR